jgi:hypothetical protein
MRLVGAPSPSISRETEEKNEGDPLAQSREQGPIFFDYSQRHRDRACRVGKGVGTAFNMNRRFACAVPTNGLDASRTIVGGHGARQAFPC